MNMKPPKKKASFLRFIWVMFKWTVRLLMILFILLLALATLTYFNAERIAKAIIDRSVESDTFSVGEVKLLHFDEVIIKDVELRITSPGVTYLITSEVASIRVSPFSVSRHRIDNLSLHSPLLKLVSNDITVLPSPKDRQKESRSNGNAQDSVAKEDWILSFGSTFNGKLIVALDKLPRLEGDLKVHARDLPLCPDILKASDPQHLEVSDIQVFLPDKEQPFTRITNFILRFSFDEMMEGRFQSLYVGEAETVIGADFFKLPIVREIASDFYPLQTESQVIPSSERSLTSNDQPSSDSGKSNQDQAQGEVFFPRFKFFEISDWHLELSGLGSSLPEVKTGLRIRNVQDASRDNTDTKVIAMRDLLIAYGGDTVLEVPSIVIRGDEDSLLGGRLDAIAIENPNLQINAVLRNLFYAIENGELERLFGIEPPEGRTLDDVTRALPGTLEKLRSGPFKNVYDPDEPQELEVFEIGQVWVRNASVKIGNIHPYLPSIKCRLRTTLENFCLPLNDAPWGQNPALREARHSIVIEDFEAAAWFAPDEPFLSIERTAGEFSEFGMFQAQRLEFLSIQGVEFIYDRSFRTYLQDATEETSGSSKDTRQGDEIRSAVSAEVGVSRNKVGYPPGTTIPAFAWQIGTLDFGRASVDLVDLPLELPDNSFVIEPKLFEEVILSPDVEVLSSEIQEIELAEVRIPSPLNPEVVLLEVDSVFCRFTLPGLLRSEIEEVTVLNPSIFVSDDLFATFARVNEQLLPPETPIFEFIQGPPVERPSTSSAPDTTNAPAEPVNIPVVLDIRDPMLRSEKPAPAPEWTVKHFEVAYGRLVIAVSGLDAIPLPWAFKTSADNLDFGNLEELKLSLNLTMPKDDIIFPGLNLKLLGLTGDLQFDLPETEDVNNLVNKVFADALHFQEFTLTDLWAALTFDENGVYIDFGGNGYDGYLNGEINIYPSRLLTWDGFISAVDLQLQPIFDVIGENNFSLSGRAKGDLIAGGVENQIIYGNGEVEVQSTGDMKLIFLDAMLEGIETDWAPGYNTDMTRITLEALRDYRFDTGSAELDYAGNAGKLRLTFDGDEGMRDIRVNLEHAESTLEDWILF